MADEDYMRLAIQAAKAGHDTWTNPHVGACIVKDGQVLATGCHYHYGREHAERNAINKLTPEQLFGSTIYVTLEPCSHYGKQPPCAELLVQSGFKRVVVATLDPHPLVTGKGIKILKDAGIEVEVGLLAKEARALNPFYNFYYEHGRPYISLKQAITLDGKVAVKGERTPITNAAVKKQVLQERGDYQAIMVGAKTAIIDNPTLLTSKEGDFPPIRVVVDRRGRLLDHLDLKLLQTGPETWVLTLNEDLANTVFPDNVHVLLLPGRKARDIAQLLREKGIQSVYLEGGPTLAKAFLDADLADDLITYLAPFYLGKQTTNGVASQEQLQLTDTKIQTFNDNIRIYGRIQHV